MPFGSFHFHSCGCFPRSPFLFPQRGAALESLGRSRNLCRAGPPKARRAEPSVADGSTPKHRRFTARRAGVVQENDRPLTIAAEQRRHFLVAVHLLHCWLCRWLRQGADREACDLTATRCLSIEDFEVVSPSVSRYELESLSYTLRQAVRFAAACTTHRIPTGFLFFGLRAALKV